MRRVSSKVAVCVCLCYKSLKVLNVSSGPHSVEVCYDGAPVPKSPFHVSVTEGCDPGRVRVHGPGLKGGTTNKPNKFTIETRYDKTH